MRVIFRGTVALSFLIGSWGTATGQVRIQEENTNVGTTAAEFLSLGAGARGMALGGSFAALSQDVEALYYNPAGLPLMDTGLQAMFTTMPYFADTDYFWAGLAFPFGAGQFAVGLSLGNFGFSDQPVYTESDPEGESGETYSVNETYVGLSFAHAFIDRFTGGITLKFIADNLGQTSAEAYAVDIGTNFHTELGGRPIALSVVIQNLGTSLEHTGTGLDFTAFPEPEAADEPVANVDPSPARFQTQSFPLPTVFRVGLAYDAVATESSRLTLLGEFNEMNNNDPSWGFAGEYEFSGPVIGAALRLSYSYQPDNSLSEEEEARLSPVVEADGEGTDGLALGGGLKYRFADDYEARFDYAWRHFGALGSKSVFSFGFAFR